MESGVYALSLALVLCLALPGPHSHDHPRPKNPLHIRVHACRSLCSYHTCTCLCCVGERGDGECRARFPYQHAVTSPAHLAPHKNLTFLLGDVHSTSLPHHIHTAVVFRLKPTPIVSAALSLAPITPYTCRTRTAHRLSKVSTTSRATMPVRPVTTATVNMFMSPMTLCQGCVAKHDLAYGPSDRCPFDYPIQDTARGARLEKDLKLYTRLIDRKLKRMPLDMRQRIYLSNLCPGHLAVLMGLPSPTPMSSSSSFPSCELTLSSFMLGSPEPRTSPVPGLELGLKQSFQGERMGKDVTATTARGAAVASTGPAHAAAVVNDNGGEVALLSASSNAHQHADERQEDRHQQQQGTPGPTDELLESGKRKEGAAAGVAPTPQPPPPPVAIAVTAAPEAGRESMRRSARVFIPGRWESEESESLWCDVYNRLKGVVDLTILLAEAFGQATCAALGHMSCVFIWV